MRVVLVCLCTIFVLGIVDSPHAVIDDFDDGNAKGWQEIQGTWSVQSKEYVQEETEWTTTTTNETYTRSFFGDENWMDYTLEATVRMEGGGETAAIIGIFFRVTEMSEAGDYYYFRLDARAAEGPALIKSPNTILQENLAKPSEMEQDYVLKVEVEGNNIRCYIDDELEIELQDDSFANGAIGVGTFNTQGYFDNVTVNGAGIAPNPVSQAGKLALTWASVKAE